MMDGLPAGLADKIHPVYGGAILFGGWFLLQCLSAFRQMKKEQREGVERVSKREEDRQGRLSQGFAALDASRDKEIERLNAQLDDGHRRRVAEVDRLEGRLVAKAAHIERLEAAILRLEEDRDRGWDLARECDDALHEQRHAANNRMAVAFAAGKLGEPMPDEIPEVPPLSSRTGKRPE